MDDFSLNRWLAAPFMNNPEEMDYSRTEVVVAARK
jgi:hypothetical protein